MGLAIKPIECNMNCQYCYEKELRESGKYPKFNLDKVLKRLEKEIVNYKEVALHGGEPLCIGYENVKKILNYLALKKKKCGIQTNGTLINDRFIKLFKKHNIHVGFSLDGLTVKENTSRLYGQKEPQKMLDTILNNMKKCERAGLRTSVIVLIQKDNINNIIPFVKTMFEDYKIKGMRVNSCIDKLGAVQRNIYKQLTNLVLYKGYDIRPIKDIVSGLQGKDSVCIFNQCDIHHTESEKTIMGNGALSNCLKISERGLTLRSEKKSYIRYQVLPLIDQKHGGCKGCEYWALCFAGCPGAGINDDWRNKTRFCEHYKIMFKYISDMMINLGIINCIPKQRINVNAEGNGHGDKHNNIHGDKPHGDSG